MPRLFVALPVPEEIADGLIALQSGVPDARWVPSENFHVTLCFAARSKAAHAATSRRSCRTSHRSLRRRHRRGRAVQQRQAAACAGRHGRESDRLDWLHQKVSTVARNCGIAVERRKFRPHVTPGALRQQCRDRPSPGAVHGQSRHLPRRPWIADHFALYSSRSGRNGSIYTEEAAYGLTF